MAAGLFPTFSRRFRSNPKILGVANSFAAGLFMAIAIMHVLPEEITAWEEYCDYPKKIFPLPELLAFAGYVIILLLDKVLFDAHAIFDAADNTAGVVDPAEKKLERDIRGSFHVRDNIEREAATTMQMKSAES